MKNFKIKKEFENRVGMGFFVEGLGRVCISPAYLTDEIAEKATASGLPFFEKVKPEVKKTKVTEPVKAEKMPEPEEKKTEALIPEKKKTEALIPEKEKTEKIDF